MGKEKYGSHIIHRVVEYELLICNIAGGFRRPFLYL